MCKRKGRREAGREGRWEAGTEEVQKGILNKLQTAGEVQGMEGNGAGYLGEQETRSRGERTGVINGNKGQHRGKIEMGEKRYKKES